MRARVKLARVGSRSWFHSRALTFRSRADPRALTFRSRADPRGSTLALLCLLGCGHERIAAVTGVSCEQAPEQEACALPVWPNAYSNANSDPWLSAHHDALREVQPRVLVLDFHNAQTSAEVRRVAERQIDALSEGSRYHAYENPNAASFLHYQLVDLIDLKDKPPARDWRFTSSSRVPLNDDGRFDLPALFGPDFAKIYGYTDDRGEALALCALFERGLIHELWLAVGDDATGREPPPMVECKVPYDERGQRSDAGWVGTANGDNCASFPLCRVSVRIAHLSPLRGLGCDLLVRGWAIRGSVRAIPYLGSNARGFFTNCGDSEFPPNATGRTDFENRTPAPAVCAHYGLHDAADGSDLRESYSFDTIAALSTRYSADCGAPWQIYWRQSMPGLDNQAEAQDGTPMKNWWPFLFY
jgi:hypothetical protein